jgi:DNA repair protein RadC
VKCSQLKVIYSEKVQSAPLTCSGDSYRFFLSVWDKNLMSLQEQVYVLFLNGANEVIGWRCMNTGTCSRTLFDIKLTLSIALNCMATKIMVAHNHPNSVLRASDEDIAITNKLTGAACYLDISVADHLILTNRGYFSFLDNNLHL